MSDTKNPLADSLTHKDKSVLSLALVGLGIFGIISILVFPALFNLRASKHWMEFNSRTNDVSSTINGVASPFIALASAFLTFLAFWIQYRANVLQKAIFMAELQRKEKEDTDRETSWHIERFESRFYELIRLHKANVDEMAAGNTVGRKLFGPMFYELRYIYFYAEAVIRQNQDTRDALPPGFNLLKFSYTIFFFGIGPNSELNFLPGFKDGELELFRAIKSKAMELRTSFIGLRNTVPNATYFSLGGPISGESDRLTGHFYYTPYDGHVSRLGHYYRHLFQTATYIIGHEKLDGMQKYSYVKLLRAQLSDYEQLLLYYNALAWFEDKWRILFTDYRLIRNIPLPLADFSERPDVHYHKDVERLRNEGEEMFQWLE